MPQLQHFSILQLHVIVHREQQTCTGLEHGNAIAEDPESLGASAPVGLMNVTAAFATEIAAAREGGCGVQMLDPDGIVLF